MSKLIYNQLANHKKFNKSVKFGLKRIKIALGLLGHPEKKLKNVINVIGERFYMGDGYLTHSEIKKTIKQIEKLNIPLTVFECLTLVYILNASKINADYNIQETGALWKLDSNNINDFPIIQICTNVNKQHLNFLKRKTLDEVIK